MGLEELLLQEMNKALKSNDRSRLSTIRMIRTALKNKEIEVRRKLTEEEIVRVIQAMVRKGEEAIEQFKAGGRQDLVEKESSEIEILKSFIPQPLARDEILKLIEESIRETGATSPSELGKVMKSVMPKLSGRADGKLVNQLVRERLSSKPFPA